MISPKLLSDDSNYANETSLTSDDLVSSKSLSEQELDVLSKDFCETLTRNGKGAISLYNLHKLLENFPDKPRECLKAAKAFISTRPADSHSVNDLDLYSFLKRAGLKDKLWSFRDNKINSVADLFAWVDKNSSNLVGSINDLGIDIEEAQMFEDILKKKDNDRAALIKFAMHNRKKIMDDFVTFYRMKNSKYITLIYRSCF
jgi:hypothetical protein